MTGFTHDDWVRHLRALAHPVVSCGRPNLSDAVAEPLLIDTCDDPGRSAPHPRPERDAALWWALIDASVDVDAVLDGRADGPLFEQGLYRTIEVWTESDLCALHALWSLAQRRARSDWAARCATARDWHLENTQPDNATNRPWALHVFLLAETPDANLYAQTLLHNAIAMSGTPDTLSAWILEHAAGELEAR